MQKDEIMKVHKKAKEDRKQRREQVDGPSNMHQLMDNNTATAFEISDEQQAQNGYSKFLEMINSTPIDEDDDPESGYQRLANGMGVNENKKSLKK